MNSPIRLLAALTLALAVSAVNAVELLNLNFNEASDATAAGIPNTVTNNAGALKGPFAP